MTTVGVKGLKITGNSFSCAMSMELSQVEFVFRL